MHKSLDAKLAQIRSDPACGQFVLADAKDADMAHGMAAPGKSPEMHAQEARYRSLQDYRELIRQNTRQGLIDIMLMSASTNEVLTIGERLFADSHVTPAIRANDTTDIWLASGGSYAAQPSRPFRSATIDHAMCGKAACEPSQRGLGADLGLYSITFNNDRDLDHQSLEQYARFRAEAEAKGFRHFLEVFAPNAPAHPIPNVGRYLNDMIARALAGVVGASRPLFLKIPYLGAAPMEQLAAYDSSLVVGILGGSAGTTHDAFHQLAEAKKHGARVALYGRMINASENQLAFIRHLRAVADEQLAPSDAVKSYHDELKKLDIVPYRSLSDDLALTTRDSAYGGSGTARPASQPPTPKGETDFSGMSQSDKVQWNLERWRKILG